MLAKWWRRFFAFVLALRGDTWPRRAPAHGTPSRFGFPEAAGRRSGLAENVAPVLAEAEFAERAPGRVLAGTPGSAFPDVGPRGHRGRMRERLVERGEEGIADYELLEMLLFFAFKQGDTKPLAKALIGRFGSFAGVLSATREELEEMPGVGMHAVAALRLVRAAAVRLARAEVVEQPVLGNWDRLMEYLTAVMSRERIEQFRILFLDAKNRLIADEAQAKGTVNHTPVYPREVVKRALELHATALILVHNHPSGDPAPSREDLGMTGDIQDACAALGILVHDHIIIGKGRWFSFRQEGRLA